MVCMCWCCCCIIYEAARFCCDSFSLSLEPESWFYLILNRGINRAALDALMAIQVDCFRILFQVRPCEQASASQITQRLLHSYKCDSHVAIVSSEHIHPRSHTAIYSRIYRRANNGKNCLINAHASMERREYVCV